MCLWNFSCEPCWCDIEIYVDDSRKKCLSKFHFLRQQNDKSNGENRSLADYVASKESGFSDHIGAFAVTTGHGVEEFAKSFEAVNDDYNSIMVKALGDRFAEAFAEYLHKEVRRLWGFGADESLSSEELIGEKYRGIRPAAGYPACPDHWDQFGVILGWLAAAGAGSDRRAGWLIALGSNIIQNRRCQATPQGHLK